MAEVTYSAMGTRMIMLDGGGMIIVTKDEESAEVIRLSVQDPDADRHVHLALTPTEALTMIEYLAVAARPGVGEPYITAEAEALPPPKKD